VELPVADLVPDRIAAKPPILLLKRDEVTLVEDHHLLVGDELTKHPTPVVGYLLPDKAKPEAVEEPLDVEARLQPMLPPELGGTLLEKGLRNEGHGFGGEILSRR
jgi:hypothetical protein